jgi:hypothetical protein
MTTQAPISVLHEAGRRGVKLEAHGNDLHVIPGERVSPDFVPVLKANKPALLALLKLPFVMVDSEVLKETIPFCEDEDTKTALVEAGAEPASVYTREELRVLVEQHRRAPITAAELLRIHGARRAFNGRLTT